MQKITLSKDPSGLEGGAKISATLGGSGVDITLDSPIDPARNGSWIRFWIGRKPYMGFIFHNLEGEVMEM